MSPVKFFTEKGTSDSRSEPAPNRGSRLFRRAGLCLSCLSLLLLIGFPACHKKPKFSNVEESQVRPAEEWLKNESVKALADYVRIDTSPSKGEEEGARFLKNFFDCAQIESEIVCPAQRRCNLLARLPGRKRDGALLLLNHIDVAPIANTWKEARPFEGRIKLGYLYGRGSYDMKSIGLAQALAMKSLKRRGIVPSADILFLGEADEETDQKWGSRWLLEHRPEWFAGVANVLNEGGTSEVILRDVRFLGLEAIEAGYAFAELEAPSMEPLQRLSRRWQTLKSETVAPHPQAREAFAVAADHMPVPLTDYLKHLDRVRQNPSELAALPSRYASFLEARIQWTGPFRGFSGASESFREFVVVSVPPGLAPDPFLAPIEKDASSAGIRILHRASSGVTTGSPYPTPFTDLIRRVVEVYYPGVPFAPMPGFGGFTTSALFRARGIPAYGFLPVVANITDASRRHGPDERVFLTDYVRGVDVYREILEEFAFSNE
jgi:acetylornithine deacetylase/succinyl-diaminopimelate desuccinylase-like protein